MAIKKIKKAAKAVYYGTKDYHKEYWATNDEADRIAGVGRGSVQLDAAATAKELDKLLKERGISWLGSVKKRYKSM